jgi:hypothetical protein
MERNLGFREQSANLFFWHLIRKERIDIPQIAEAHHGLTAEFRVVRRQVNLS